MNLLSENTKELLYDIFIREYPCEEPLIDFKKLKKRFTKNRRRKARIEAIHLEMSQCSEARLQELVDELTRITT